MDEFKELIKEIGQTLLVYLGVERSADPFEQNVTTTFISPIPIQAIVTDLTPTQVQWKMVGVTTNKAKEVIVPKSKRNLIEQSSKIVIDGDDYLGWRDSAGKMVIREIGDYIRIYCYSKIGV